VKSEKLKVKENNFSNSRARDDYFMKAIFAKNNVFKLSVITMMALPWTGIFAAATDEAVEIAHSFERFNESSSLLDFVDNLSSIDLSFHSAYIFASPSLTNLLGWIAPQPQSVSVPQNFILEDFSKAGVLKNRSFTYDAEVSSLALNMDFYTDIKKLEPFGTGNPIPTFLLKDLKIIKTTILDNKHISLILKSKTGLTIKSISFNSVNNKVGQYLLNYKNNLNVLGQINENIWNNKKTLQLTIRDVII